MISDWCCNVLFCTNQARSFGNLARSLSALRDFRGENQTSEHWMSLGRFDHIIVTLAKDEDGLLAPEEFVQNSPHATSHWACFGRVIDCSPGLFPAHGKDKNKPKSSPKFPTDKHGLLGVCGIKLAHKVRDALPTLDDVAKAIGRRLEGIPGEWLICSTTGWEDMVLLFWTDAFHHLAQVLGKMRGLLIDDLSLSNVGGVHAVLTTCTMAGIHLPAGVLLNDDSSTGTHQWSSDGWIRELDKSISPEAPLDWAVRFELRPGHLDAFNQALQDRARRHWTAGEVNKLSLKNLLGQYDYRVQQQGGNQKSWLQFLLQVALPLATEEHTLVRAMETRPHIDLPTSLHEGQGSKKAKPLFPLPPLPSIQTIIDVCKKSAIPGHTIKILCATHGRLSALREDDLQHDTFKSVERLFTCFSEGVSSFRHEGLEGLDQDLFVWLHCVERSLADRYRGTYPLGEAVVTRLGTYQASHQSFLVAMDCIAQDAFHLASLSFQNSLGGQQELPKIAICCFIGNSPSPNAKSISPHLRCGFIELAASMIFRRQHLSILLHEVGHLFTNTVRAKCGFEYAEVIDPAPLPAPGVVAPPSPSHKASKPKSPPPVLPSTREIQDPELKVEIHEILAEAFACCACYNAEAGKYAVSRLNIFMDHAPQDEAKFHCSSRLVIGFRLQAVDDLLNNTLPSTPEAAETFKTRAMGIVAEQLEPYLPAGTPDRESATANAEKRVDRVIKAMRSLHEINQREPGHAAMIQAMKSLPTLPEGPKSEALRMTQEFITAGNTSLASHFLFIEKMVAVADRSDSAPQS